MNLISKNKNLMTHLAVFVVFVCIIIFFVSPFLTDIRDNAGLLFEAKRDYKFIKEKSDKINLVRKDYKNMEADLGKMSGFLIDSKTPIDLIKFWETTAKEENLDIDIGSYPIEKDDTDLWPAMGFQIKLDGSYPGFMRFLEKIEASQYFIEIKSLSAIKSADKADEVMPGGISVSLGLKIYTK